MSQSEDAEAIQPVGGAWVKAWSMKMVNDGMTTVPGTAYRYRSSPEVYELDMSLICDAAFAKEIDEMNTTPLMASKATFEALKEAIADCKSAAEELRLEKEFLVKKQNELQGLVKRLLEDR